MRWKWLGSRKSSSRRYYRYAHPERPPVIQKGRLGVALGDREGLRVEEVLVVLVLRDGVHVLLDEETVVVADLDLFGIFS
jgi:hypothetical protein